MPAAGLVLPLVAMDADWLRELDLTRVDTVLGAAAVDAALAEPRRYAGIPVLDAGRVRATIVPAPGGTRLATPVRVSARIATPPQCECPGALRWDAPQRQASRTRGCAHADWLLVDLALEPALRGAVLEDAGEALIEPILARLPERRAAALELRQLEERLAAWLPAPQRSDEIEIEIDPQAVAGTDRPVLLLRHRQAGSRTLLAARDVLALRLPAAQRRLLELTAPHHGERTALVATRGQATVVIQLLRERIGVRCDKFRAHVRYATAPAHPRAEASGGRLVARWFDEAGTLLGDAADVLLFAGPFPWLWVPATHTFHPIAEAVDLDAALGLQRVPSLPIHDDAAARVGTALLVRGRGLGLELPPPQTFGLPPLEAPAFELRLSGSPLDVHAELIALYGAGRAPVLEAATQSWRHMEAEEAALAQLARAGIERAGGELCAQEDDAVRLWTEGLDTLRTSTAPHYEIKIAQALGRPRLLGEVHVDVRVNGEPGWLETQLEFRASSLVIDIQRMHATLAEGRRWLVLDDGALARIGDEVAELVGLRRGPAIQWLTAESTEHVHVHLDSAATSLRDRRVEREPALPSMLRAELRPYQRVGVAWLQWLQAAGTGGILADDMGLGKTITTLAFLARWYEDAGPATSLVVCPTSVLGNWAAEAERFVPGLAIRVWAGAGRGPFPENAALVITSYGILRRELDTLRTVPLRALVLDEAQHIKNPSSDTARAACALSARMRLALTGTPVENRALELWSLMEFAVPGLLGSRRDFERRHELPHLGPALLRARVQPFVLRRTKRAVLAELPPKTEIERACVLGAPQKRMYDALALALRQAIARDLEARESARARMSALTAILRLRQLACDPRLVDAEASPEHSAKRAAFLDLVRALVAEGRRALVFSQFVELLGLWRADLDAAHVRYEYLDGSTQRRDDVVRRFQEGDAPLFLISLKAGGAGLNLTAADTVIHCDPWWNPAVEDQADARAHRLGQTKPVTVIRLVARGTIEDKIALLKRHKRDLVAALVSDEPPPEWRLDASELDALLANADELEDE